jgi:hypothetical protein
MNFYALNIEEMIIGLVMAYVAGWGVGLVLWVVRFLVFDLWGAIQF